MKQLLTMALLTIGISASAQTNKNSELYLTDDLLKYLVMMKGDSTYVVHNSDEIACIAYIKFSPDGTPMYVQARNIIRKYEHWYSMKWNAKNKKYNDPDFRYKMGFWLNNSSEIKYYTNETFWHEGKQIFPIEILTTTKIK
jgi:hypothetical protein